MDLANYQNFEENFQGNLIKGNTSNSYIDFIDFISFVEPTKYDSTRTYGVGSLVTFSEESYISVNTDTGIAPDTVNNVKWVKVPELPKLYDQRIRYDGTELFFYNNAIYFFNTSTQGIQQKTGNFTLYNSNNNYGIGDIVFSGDYFYIAVQEPLVATVKIAPDRECNGYWLPFSNNFIVSCLLATADQVDHQIGLYNYTAIPISLNRGGTGANHTTVIEMSLSTYSDVVLSYFSRTNQHYSPTLIVLKRYRYFPANTGDARYQITSVTETILSGLVNISLNNNGRVFSLRGYEVDLLSAQIPNTFFDEQRFPGISYDVDRATSGK